MIVREIRKRACEQDKLKEKSLEECRKLGKTITEKIIKVK